MRKYFLISAVAILAATNANADMQYAEINTNVTIRYVDAFECSDLEWGILTLKKNHGEIIVHGDGSVDGDKVGLLDFGNGGAFSNCSYIGSEYIGPENFNLPETVQLTGADSNNNISMKDIQTAFDGDYILIISGSLYIPADAEADTYNGTFTISVTY